MLLEKVVGFSLFEGLIKYGNEGNSIMDPTIVGVVSQQFFSGVAVISTASSEHAIKE